MLKSRILNLAAAVFVAAGLFFTGCKSAPLENTVDPVELLSDDGAIYLTVPVGPNRDFVKQAVMRLASCSESDAEKITDRTDNIYICIGRNGNVELSCSGDFPSKMIGLALSEKNGWTKNTYNEYKYFKNRRSSYEISLPSSSAAIISVNVETMLSRYDECANNDLHSVSMDKDVYAFLKSENSADIQIFSPLPKVFVKTFIGADVNAPVESITGSFSRLKQGSEFGLKITVKMSDPKTVKAAAAALKIALFPVPAKIVQTGYLEITVTDITLGFDDLLKFMR